VNIKEYKKTYPFVCSECNQLNHTLREFCESCGAQNTMHSAKKEDYKNKEF
jgi:rRNA maturation endonuclease Nob1